MSLELVGAFFLGLALGEIVTPLLIYAGHRLAERAQESRPYPSHHRGAPHG